ncbi:FRA10AC1 [Labeo rohita]|uniref:FRA10AC1 n=1 Tax=Labeo rohita TaxID=84645 RepID=A0A498LXA6_LABRO|nr:FRA10AC1 [Labeo rohita]
MSGMDKTALDLVKVHGGGGYDSDFSDDDGGGGQSKYGENRAGKDELLQKPFQKGKHTKLAHKNVAAHEWDRSKDKTDLDVVRENHRFLWREEDEEDMTWEKELAKKYYDKLFKEYCIADLSRYKENKTLLVSFAGFNSFSGAHASLIGGMYVIRETGQFLCGNKRCENKEGLKSWEVNFAYVEQGEKRNALVKLRLCPECSFKLNYHHKILIFKFRGVPEFR